MSKIIKADLNTAAYYMLYGAELIAVDIKSTGWVFELEKPADMFQLIQYQPLVNHIAYMKKRRKLKEKIDKFTHKVHIKSSNWGKSFLKEKWSQG